MMTEFEHLPYYVKAVIEKCRSGQRLCRSFRTKETGDVEEIFIFEPTGKRVGQKSAAQALETGFLKPLGDGLLEIQSSQTWVAE